MGERRGRGAHMTAMPGDQNAHGPIIGQGARELADGDRGGGDNVLTLTTCNAAAGQRAHRVKVPVPGQPMGDALSRSEPRRPGC